jgi:hypothetical protein
VGRTAEHARQIRVERSEAQLRLGALFGRRRRERGVDQGALVAQRAELAQHLPQIGHQPKRQIERHAVAVARGRPRRDGLLRLRHGLGQAHVEQVGLKRHACAVVKLNAPLSAPCT